MSSQNFDQKSRLDISKYLLSFYDSEGLMRRSVTQVDKRVHHFDSKAKRQSM